jgi:agmatinase
VRELAWIAAILFALPAAAAQADWSVPEELAEKVAGLSADRRHFIESGAAVELLPERQLLHELANRDPDDLGVFIDDLMIVAARMGYDPKRDMGAAPLNLTTRRFHRGVATHPELREMERAPGPFGVHRYLYPKSGVPTFAGAPVAIWPEDLVAGGVDVAIVGVPSNLGSGRRDAARAPDVMRAMNTIGVVDGQSLLRPLDALSVVDYGDFVADDLSVERSVNHLADMVAETAQTDAIPMLVGGDTSVLYPALKGLARVHGYGSFGLLHLSAHPDADQFGDHTLTDRRALLRAIEDGLVIGADVVQLGLRGPDVDAATLQWLRERGVRYHTMAEVRKRGFERVLKRALREVNRGPDDWFIAMDVSVLAPRDMVAAGRITTQGLPIEQVVATIRRVCASKRVVGFEITDLAPMLDLSRQSVLNANAALNACLVGVALRKTGLDADYVHPLALDHGR